MADLITEARELCGRATPGPWKVVGEDAWRMEGFPQVEMNTPDGKYFPVHNDTDAAFIARSRTIIPELCDALEKAKEQNKQLVREVSQLACESVERDRALAKLEAEVMAIREAMASVHKSLDFADAQRQSSKNYTELAINNGLALGRIAVALKHDFKQPLPAPPEEGAEHERD